MLGIPRSIQNKSTQPASGHVPPTGLLLRGGFLAALLASVVYVVIFWNPTVPVDESYLAIEPPLVEVPDLDSQVLAKAKDATHEDRLFLEGEPLQHLLELSLNVSPEIADAMGRPAGAVPIEELREDSDGWRGRWIFYKGQVEALSGPRKGHPVDGYDIYEATLRLENGETVLFTFSKAPENGVRVGSWARAEGFLLKLRDAAFPREITKAPFLVGKRLVRDFDTWDPVTEIDPEILSRILDTRLDGDEVRPSPDAWRSIDIDQKEPLWHLAAYAMAHADTPLAEARKVPLLNATSTWDAYKLDEVPRGAPQRIIGTVVMLRSITAQPNPAGIQRWTEAWLQVPDLKGKTVPIWVPKQVSPRIGSTVEVLGYYFRRYAYETRTHQSRWTTLFVAANLPLFRFDLKPGMQEFGWAVLAGISLLILFAVWSVRRENKRAKTAEAGIAERRKRRRLKSKSVTTEST